MMKKRGLPLLLVLSLLVFAPAAQAGFADVVDTAWYAIAVDYAQEKGFMTGVPGGLFSPEGTMSRGMLATVLHRMAGSPDAIAGLYFEDVRAEDWYGAGVAWCAEQGVVSGTDLRHFSPDAPVTREQVAVMLWRLAGRPASEHNAAFTDRARISSWSKLGVDWASQAGIVSGRPDGSFQPQGAATRAEVAQMLMNYDLWRAAQG